MKIAKELRFVETLDYGIHVDKEGNFWMFDYDGIGQELIVNTKTKEERAVVAKEYDEEDNLMRVMYIGNDPNEEYEDDGWDSDPDGGFY